MPHFSKCCGSDEYICQLCAQVFCAQCKTPEWRPEITGHNSAGNVCPHCVEVYIKDHPGVKSYAN